jgi:hypothetical protein
MNLKKVAVLSGFIIVMIAAAQIVLAQEAAVTPTDSPLITANQPVGLQKESDMQWAWGEVTNLDNQAKTVTLKYLDYETDQEKEMVLAVDEKTTFENIKDFNELKLKDTLSIDYLAGVDNKNIAKNISLEKPDVSSSTLAPAENSQPVIPPLVTEQPSGDVAAPAVPALAQPVTQSETPADSSVTVNALATSESAPVTSESAAPVTSESAPAVQSQAQ